MTVAMTHGKLVFTICHAHLATHGEQWHVDADQPHELYLQAQQSSSGCSTDGYNGCSYLSAASLDFSLHVTIYLHIRFDSSALQWELCCQKF